MMLWRFSDNKETNDEISALHLKNKIKNLWNQNQNYSLRFKITLKQLLF
jgi:hypothetical protein